MPRYRHQLPQLKGGCFLTDGGLETTLVFHDGMDLPGFAAFVLLESEGKRERLRQYYRDYMNLARDYGVGFVLESATWRANREWGEKLGYTQESLDEINRRSIRLLEQLRTEYDGEIPHIVVSGCLGQRGDGYGANVAMTSREAAAYHHRQIAIFRETEADMVSAFTIPYIAESEGIVRAARAEGVPVVISYTVETDGRLPSGETLKDAIERVDDATDGWPAYYMINCAHPAHFSDTLGEEPWVKRIRGLRANASMRSHADLDASTELDMGDPHDLGIRYRALAGRLGCLSIFGGCCGTDHRHVAKICEFVAAIGGKPL
jgi:homocysteine S-methyltransferase